MDLLDFLHESVEVLVNNVLHLDLFLLEGLSHDLLDFIPLFVENGFGGEALDQGQVLHEVLDFHSQLLGCFRSLWEVFVELLVKLEARRVPLLHRLVNLVGVLLHQLVLGPVFETEFNLMGHRSQFKEGFELVIQVEQFWVLGLVLVEETFSLIELLHLLEG